MVTTILYRGYKVTVSYGEASGCTLVHINGKLTYRGYHKAETCLQEAKAHIDSIKR